MKSPRYILGEARRWLARRQPCAFRPLADVEGSGASWRLVGADPALAVEPAYGLLPRGWVMLEVRADSDLPVLTGKLYVDCGEGYSEETCFPFAIPAGQMVKRLCYFPRLAKSLRFDPSECPADIEIQHFVLARVSRGFARRAMLRKLEASPYIGEQRYSELAAKPLESLWEAYHELVSPSATADYAVSVARESQLYGPQAVAKRLDTLTHKPLISIVVPVFNPDAAQLRACLDSVLVQHYPHWQLCLADDASTNPEIPRILAEYAERDSRVHWVRRPENGHICRASNTALELVQGEFVALLDHDDSLAPQALLEVATALQASPSAQILYSDEDKLDAEGQRCEPHFKPDWNPDLLYSQNFVSHLGVYRTGLVRAVGGFRPGFEGCQDYDLLLRCVAQVASTEIVHIPKVLYHWRAAEGSTALASEAKGYTTQAGMRALQDHFSRRGIQVEVGRGIAPNTYRVRYLLDDAEPLVSLLIPTRDGYDILRQCIESILAKTTYANYEILVLNNQTTCERTLQYFGEIACRDNVRIVDYDFPFNYSAMNNFGVRQARGAIIGLVNNDIEVISPGWLEEMVSQAARPEIGCVGAKLYYPNDTVQHAGVVLGLGGVAGHSHKHFPRSEPGYFYRLNLVQNYSAVTAACLLVRKSVFEEVGGLDEENLKVAFNDVDFCLKVRDAGYRNLWTPYAELYHHESISRGDDTSAENAPRFKQEVRHMQSKWKDMLLADPAYNRNLTLDFENFALR